MRSRHNLSILTTFFNTEMFKKKKKMPSQTVSFWKLQITSFIINFTLYYTFLLIFENLIRFGHFLNKSFFL